MKLRVRLENLVIDLGFQELMIPSMADKVIDLPNDPIPADKAFAGKRLLSSSPFEIVIKWGFKGAVGFLQQKLLDDRELDSASSWFFIDSSPSSPFDTVEAFLNGTEVPMKGRSGIIVER